MSHFFNPYVSPQSDATTSYGDWAREHPQSLRRVRLGLTVVYYTICFSILVGIATPLYFTTNANADTDYAFFAYGLVAVGWVTGFSMLFGEVMCIAVPRESGARSFAIAAVALWLLSRSMSVANSFLPVYDNLAFKISVGVAIGLVSYAGYACFVLFLYYLAQYIVQYELATRAVWVLGVGAVAAILSVAQRVLFIGTQASDMEVGISVSLLAGLLNLVAIVMYANLVTRLRKALVV